MASRDDSLIVWIILTLAYSPGSNIADELVWPDFHLQPKSRARLPAPLQHPKTELWIPPNLSCLAAPGSVNVPMLTYLLKIQIPPSHGNSMHLTRRTKSRGMHGAPVRLHVCEGQEQAGQEDGFP